MTPSAAVDYLDSFINFENRLSAVTPGEFKIGRMQKLLSRLDNPQRGITCLHVAGSKGKGTTCVFAASMLQAAGYRVGLYTSPHLHHLNERLRVLSPGGPCMAEDVFAGAIPEAALAGLVEACQPVLEAARGDGEWGRVTYFEALTALALVYFRQQQVHYAVLETGLGGRLDATNAVETAVCGITSIGLEHTKILGDTHEQIAAEKAAIIKSPQQWAVSAPQIAGVADVIARRCAEFQVPLWQVGREVACDIQSRHLDGQVFTVQTPLRTHADLQMTIVGDCFARNAAVAIGMIDRLNAAGHPVPADAVSTGLAWARMPARFEVVQTHPYVIVDGAHTPDAGEALIRNLGAVLPLRKVIVVLGLSDDKDAAGMARCLNLVARDIILTRSRHPRAAHLTREGMAAFFPDKDILVTGDVVAALRQGLDRAQPDDVLLVTGSLFLAAEARQYFKALVNK